MTPPLNNIGASTVLLMAAATACGCAAAGTLDSLLPDAVWSSPRDWSADGADGSVHCMGNGRLCAYGRGPNVLQVFGPSYSTTNLGRIALDMPGATCQSRRVMGTAIWEHRIVVEGRAVAVVTDFVDSERASLVRCVKTTEPLRVAFQPEPGVRQTEHKLVAQGNHLADGLLLETPIGKPSVPFGNYPIPFAFFHHVAWRGAVEAACGAANEPTVLRFLPGEATLYISGGPDLSACLAESEATLATGDATLLARTRTWWNAFTAKGRDFAAELPQAVPMRARLIEVLDGVAVLIKAQQAAEGGILAGYPYHLGYVRDQYGTHRGLVALGHREMSREILAFYHGIFESYGRIHNAQAFGIPGLFHIHENDEVEITGYLVLQAFDYLACSDDTAFLKRIFPMLEWAWTVQQRNLIGNMLPFNGDETYVAGGILPRTTLNDGSAEATLLLIDGGRLLLAFAEKEGLWSAERIRAEQQRFDVVRDSFRGNFWRESGLITNNPDRARDPQLLPRVRHGVCEACVTVQWTLRSENGRYVCVNCMNKPPLPAVEPRVYQLQSVTLTPLYFHSAVLGRDELQPQADEIVRAYKATGKLPSRPDGDVAVGYDYGLLLYALTELDHPLAGELYEKTLQLADSTGAWAEYYRNHQPAGTRCRPWESAINVEALLHWINKTYR